LTASFDIVAAASPAGAQVDKRMLSPLALAYLGDTVYDMYVRAFVVMQAAHTPNELHRLAARYASAVGQAAAFRRVEPLLSEEELGWFRRGRNAHSGTVPKSASVADYHTATGLETLLGQLWITGQDERLTALMKRILEED